jgi:excisionase family DNA binding protein
VLKIERMISQKELREKIGVHQTTIERWRKDGLPFVRVGKLVRFKESEVNKWIKDQNKK